MVFLADQTDALGNPFQWLGQPAVAPGGAIIQRLQYGDFVFNPATTETLRMTATPVQDEAGRTIKYVDHYLMVRTVIVGEEPETTDAAVQSAVNTLTSQGKNLVYQQKGFGRFNINVGGGAILGAAVNAAQGVLASPQRDAAWGPVPQVVDCRPLADNHAWELVWGVSVRIPRCENAKYQDAVMDFGYEVTYGQDYGGYGTRTVKGHLEVAMTRPPGGGRRLRATADDYLDGIVIDVPAGFRQTGFSHTLALNHSRLDFVCEQEQLPGIVPPLGVLKVRLGLKESNIESGNFVKWAVTIDGEYEMASGRHQSLANAHFLAVVADRQRELSKRIPVPKDAANKGAGPGPWQKLKEGAQALGDWWINNTPNGRFVRDRFGVGGKGGAVGGGNGAVNPQIGFQVAVTGTLVGQAASTRREIGALDALAAINAQFRPNTTPQAAPDGLAQVTAAAAMAGFGAVAEAAGALAVADADIPGLIFGGQLAVFPIFWTAEDPDAYGKPVARFSCTLMAAGTLPQLLTVGLWERVVNTPKYDAWKTSLGNVWNHRGQAGLKFKADTDVIIDLCQTADTEVASIKGKLPAGGGAAGLVGAAGAAAGGAAQGAAADGMRSVWVEWQNSLEMGQDQSLTVYKPLPTDSLLATPAALAARNQSTVPAGFATTAPNAFRTSGDAAYELPSQIESGPAPTYTAEMSGFAIKVGSHPEPPQLVSVGGSPAVLSGKPRVKYETVGNVGTPLYKTSWILTYVLPQPAFTNVGAAAGYSSLTSGGLSRPF